MATSPYDDTVLVLDFLAELIFHKKARVLDVGAGFGRWGYLLRCHMGEGESLTVRREQNLRIEAIEAFETNVTPIYDCIYDHTHVGDVCDVLPTLSKYDVVIAGHVLEHVDKETGRELLREIVAHSVLAAVICLPFGDWPQGEVYGNPYEVHRATWEASDFASYGSYCRRYGRQGVVIVPISREAKWHVEMMRNPLRRCFFRIVDTLRDRFKGSER